MLHLPIWHNLSWYSDKFCMCYIIGRLLVFQVLYKKGGLFPGLKDQNQRKMAHILNRYLRKSKMHEFVILVDFYLISSKVDQELLLMICYLMLHLFYDLRHKYRRSYPFLFKV